MSAILIYESCCVVLFSKTKDMYLQFLVFQFSVLKLKAYTDSISQAMMIALTYLLNHLYSCIYWLLQLYCTPTIVEAKKKLPQTW